MELKEMIKVMQHFEDGGEVEIRLENNNRDNWRPANNPSWSWKTYDYRIKKQKQKVTIEKWLLYDKGADIYFECRTSNVDKIWDSHNNGKVKLLKSYEIEI